MISEIGDVDREVRGDVGRELAKLFLVRGGIGQGEIKFSGGGIGQGEKIFLSADHIFLKFYGGGICMGNYKKNSGGGCGWGNKKYRREI